MGIVGSGPAALCHAQALGLNRHFRLDAFSSRNRVQAAELARRFRCRAVLRPSRLIQDPNIDAVILAVPPAAQPGYLRIALARRIPVLCEKPLAANSASVRRVLPRIRRRTSHAGINFCYRMVPQIAWFRQCIRRQVAGIPWQVHVEWILGNRIGKMPDSFPSWKRSDRQGGGVLMNYGIHVLDYLFGGMESPHFVGSTWQKIPGRQAAEAGSMLWKSSQGLYQIDLSLLSGQSPVHRLILRGPRGTVTVENASLFNPAGPFRILTEGKPRILIPPRPGSLTLKALFARLHDEWLPKRGARCAQGLPSLNDGLQALRLAEMAT